MPMTINPDLLSPTPPLVSNRVAAPAKPALTDEDDLEDEIDKDVFEVNRGLGTLSSGETDGNENDGDLDYDDERFNQVMDGAMAPDDGSVGQSNRSTSNRRKQTNNNYQRNSLKSIKTSASNDFWMNGAAGNRTDKNFRSGSSWPRIQTPLLLLLPITMFLPQWRIMTASAHRSTLIV